MNRRKGFSLVEVVLASALTVVVVGTLASVYSLATRQAARAVASINGTRQAQILATEIAKTVSNSVYCAVITSGGNTGLRCTMPQNGTDKDGDGYLDEYTPYIVSKRGIEKFGRGKRVWYYFSDSTGNFTNTGTVLWRAQRNDDLLPTTTDKDSAWAFYYGTSNSRWKLIESINFSVDANAKTTTFTIIGSQKTGAERTATNSDVTMRAGYRTTLSRTSFWRNWRK